MGLVNLDPTVGSEIRKTRSCVVVSPAEIQDHLDRDRRAHVHQESECTVLSTLQEVFTE